jgi:hypothetical protein
MNEEIEKTYLSVLRNREVFPPGLNGDVLWAEALFRLEEKEPRLGQLPPKNTNF